MFCLDHFSLHCIIKMLNFKVNDPLKLAGVTGVQELLRVFQGIMGGEHAPDEWHNSLTIHLYKGK